MILETISNETVEEMEQQIPKEYHKFIYSVLNWLVSYEVSLEDGYRFKKTNSQSLIVGSMDELLEELKTIVEVE